jgi:hypothetical protein
VGRWASSSGGGRAPGPTGGRARSGRRPGTGSDEGSGPGPDGGVGRGPGDGRGPRRTRRRTGPERPRLHPAGSGQKPQIWGSLVREKAIRSQGEHTWRGNAVGRRVDGAVSAKGRHESRVGFKSTLWPSGVGSGLGRGGRAGQNPEELFRVARRERGVSCGMRSDGRRVGRPRRTARRAAARRAPSGRPRATEVGSGDAVGPRVSGAILGS